MSLAHREGSFQEARGTHTNKLSVPARVLEYPLASASRQATERRASKSVEKMQQQWFHSPSTLNWLIMTRGRSKARRDTQSAEW
jgi:hypothetical protein